MPCGNIYPYLEITFELMEDWQDFMICQIIFIFLYSVCEKASLKMTFQITVYKVTWKRSCLLIAIDLHQILCRYHM